MNYSQVLKKTRLRVGLTQEALAEKADLGKRGRVYLAQLENGDITIPGADRWAKICDALGIDPTTGEHPVHSNGAILSVRNVADGTGAYMVQQADGEWCVFNLFRDPEKYPVGTVLPFKDMDGTIGRIRVVMGENGRKGVVPA